MLRDGITECPCPKVKCKNHSKCELCIQRHAKKRSKPYCERKNDKMKNVKGTYLAFKRLLVFCRKKFIISSLV